MLLLLLVSVQYEHFNNYLVLGEIDEALVQLAIEGSSNSEEEEYKSTFEAFPLEATSYENQVPYQYVATFEKVNLVKLYYLFLSEIFQTRNS